MTVEPYLAAALQLRAQSAEAAADAASARAQVLERIAGLAADLAGTRAFLERFAGLPLKLAVLPEYLFTGFESGRVPDFRARAVFAPDGPEYRALADLACAQGLYLAGNAYESDPHFPDLHFQASFLFAPDGNRVLTYRRLYSLYTPSPHDVWREYRRHYGLAEIFPVADTAIGRIAAIASEEILYPEVARAHALRGAELFVHSSSEAGGRVPTAKHIARQARAIENMAYVVSANTAGIEGGGLAGMSADGNSAVIDYRGRIQAESLTGENANAFAEIDIEALRRHRRKPGMGNYLARQRLELFRDIYSGSVQPADGLLRDGRPVAPDRDELARRQQDVIARLAADGLI